MNKQTKNEEALLKKTEPTSPSPAYPDSERVNEPKAKVMNLASG